MCESVSTHHDDIAKTYTELVKPEGKEKEIGNRVVVSPM